MLKLGLAPHLGLQGGYRCQTGFLLLWVLCVACAWLLPVVILVQVMPVWPVSGGMFAVCAIGWGFVQLMSGLALTVNWSAPMRQAGVDPPSGIVEPVLSYPCGTRTGAGRRIESRTVDR